MTVPPPVSLEHGSSQDNSVSLNVIANVLLLYTLLFLYYYIRNSMSFNTGSFQ